MTLYTIGSNATGNTGSLTCSVIQLSAPSSNQYAGSVNMGSASAGSIGRLPVLIGFGGLSGSGTVTNASLRLQNLDAMGATKDYSARALLNPHTQNQVTWNKRNTADNWNVAGALTGTDVDMTVIATGTMPTAANGYMYMTGAGLDSWLQGCIDGTITCTALIVSATNEAAYAPLNRIPTDLASSGLRPILTFDFVPAVPPSVSGADVLCTKHDGTTTITVTLSEAAPVGGCSVDYTTQDSTAIAGQHYTAISGTMTFAQGEQTKTATATIAP